jgi:aspartate kinase
LVVSAFKDITDKLIDIGIKISDLGRDPTSKEIDSLDEIFSPYFRFAKKEQLDDLKDEFDKMIGELKENLKFVRRSGFKGKIKDSIISTGECFSALLISSYLNRKGIRPFCLKFDGNFPIITDDNFEDANVDIQKTKEAVVSLTKKIKDKNTIIIPGFIGRTHSGFLATLGRGGSDLTAIVISISLSDNYEVETLLWKDVPITTADPKIVGKENIKHIADLSWQEAEFLSNLGGKILTSKAMKLVTSNQLPIKVPCLFEPMKVTNIFGEKIVGEAVKCVTGTKDCISVRIVGEQNRNKVRNFMEFHEYDGIFTSDGIGIPGSYETYNMTLMKKDFEKMNSKLKSIIEDAHDVALVSILGNMEKALGVIGKAGTSLEEAGINVLGTQSGVDAPSIIFYIYPKDYSSAIKILHDKFIVSKNKS